MLSYIVHKPALIICSRLRPQTVVDICDTGPHIEQPILQRRFIIAELHYSLGMLFT